MSALAVTFAPEAIVLLSDGREENGYNNKVTSQKKRKVWRLQQNVALAWLGWYPREGICDTMVSYLSEWPLQTPLQIARAAGRYLESSFTDEMFDMLDPFRYCLLVVGYDEDGFACWQIDSTKEDIFKPYRVQVAAGDSVFLGNTNGSGNGRYVELLENYCRLYRDVPYAARTAFSQLIDELAEQGHPVGGEIFCEVLTPQPEKIEA